MQQKMQQMGQMIEHLTQELQNAKQGKDQQETDIKAFDAETKRLQVVGPAVDPQMISHLATQVVMQMMQEGGLPQGAPPPDPMQQQQPPNPPSAGNFLPAQ
jgi:hypothetical protein